MPNPPAGGNACAASPARKTRPSAKRSATVAPMVQARTLRIETSSTSTSSPIARRTNAAHLDAPKSSAKLCVGGKNGICATKSPAPSSVTSCATTTATTSGLNTKYSIAARPAARSAFASFGDVKCTFTRCCMAGEPVTETPSRDRAPPPAPSAATRNAPRSDDARVKGERR